MTARSRWATTSARLVGGTVAAVALVAGTVTAVAVTWPQHELTPVAVTATPAPSESVLACPGGLLAIGRDASVAGAITLAAEATVTAGTGDRQIAPSEEALTVPAIEGSAPAVFTASPTRDLRTDLAAASSAAVAAEDLAGFAAASCAPPLLDSWLVGGAATTGSSGLLLLANPGEVPAAVQVTAYGAAGAQTPAAGTLVVAPGTQRVVPLAALARGEESPILHVTSSGAPVQAALQASITRTLVAGGVDLVGAIIAPETQQVLPAVDVTAAPGAAGASDPTTIVRLLAPARATTAVVTVRDGATTVDSREVPLEAGLPLELDLGGLAIGTYTVQVQAEAAVVAGVWATNGFAEGDDFAWHAAAPRIETSSLVAIAAGPSPTLAITNTGAQDVTVALTADAEGATAVEFTVPAQGTTRVPVTAGTLYRLEASGPVHAAVGYSGSGALASYPVWPADAAASPLIVRP